MKIELLLLFGGLICFNGFSQQGGQFWRINGNFNTNPANNFLGTTNNFGLMLRTNDTRRFNINRTLFYPINGYNGNRSGNILIARDVPINNLLYSDNFGAYSLLHLSGSAGNFVQNGGYRPWMITGVTFTDNQDLSYMGIRQVGNVLDKTETTITWSDNAIGSSGPDDMVFRFTSAGQGNTTISTNFNDPFDLDGLHVARFTGTGLFGLGNTFGINVPGQGVNYATPQSLAHLSLANRESIWMQFTNRNNALGAGGTGETANDGLRIGILGNNLDVRNGNAMIYNQENRHLLLSTAANTNSVSPTNTRERVRITNYGAPTQLAFGYGTYNPAGLNPNFTRMSISQNPNNPVTRPMSLLHIGYNTGGAFGFTTDGWRPWMDIGMFGSNGTDNFYLGLKDEGNDRFDAVVSWGDNQPAGPNGPDHLRFIFTSTTTALPPGQGDPVSQSLDGLEIGRFEPTEDLNNDSTLNDFGKFGVGDFTGTPVTHKLHVRGNARFEYVPDSAANYVLMAIQLDSANNPNDIALRKIHVDSLPTAVIDTAFVNCDSTELVFVQNGDSLFVDMSCFVDTLASGGGFVGCDDTSGIADLLSDSKSNMNDYRLYFEDGPDSLLQTNSNQIGIGYDCGETLVGKLNVDNKSEHNGIYMYMDNVIDQGNYPNTVMAGISSIVKNSTVTPTPTGAFLPAIYANAENNTPSNLGLLIETNTGNVNIGGVILAGENGVPSASNIGLRVAAIQGSSSNVGGFFGAFGVPGSNQSTGGNFTATGSNLNYGVYSSVQGTSPNNYAGYFNGEVAATNYITIVSDQNMKTNINNYDSSLYVISQLQPRTFEFTDANYQGMTLPSGHQYGLIAQEVENVLPTVVTENVHPAQYDSLGNQIQPAYNYKGLNYESFIPILIGGVKEQQAIIESQDSTISAQDSLITDLNDRLTNLENCLSNILPLLCQINNDMIQNNNNKTPEEIRHILDVELKDEMSIILDQNVPNPFAEQTRINFSIPETVKKAQIHFYNSAGQLIKSVDLEQRGLGQINVFGSDLSSGIYTYSLVADGVVVATKKMQKMNY